MNGKMGPGFVPGIATPWTNNAPPPLPTSAPTMTLPPPNFSVPPPNMCPGGFTRFSGPMYNQPTFQRSRMPSQMNMPPPFRGGSGSGNCPPRGPPSNLTQRQPGYLVNDDIFGDAPAEVPCGFPYFNPRLPPPMPQSTNNMQSHQQRGGGMMRAGGRGFHGNQDGAFNFNNRGRGGFRGRQDGALMNRGRGQFHKGRGMHNGNGHVSSQTKSKKKPKIDKRELPENNVFFCDICDRGFPTQEKKQEHVDQHQKCSYKDCPFVAAPKLVQLHMSMQHRGGMAKKIWNVESEEDIKKWKEERRKNFPTAENVQKKKERMEERVARGEVVETKDFSKMTKGRNRGRGNRRGRGRSQRGKRNGRHQADESQSFQSVDGDDSDDGPPDEIKIQRSHVEENTGENPKESRVSDEAGGEDGNQPGPVADVACPDVTKSNDTTNSLSLLSGYGSATTSDSDDGNEDNEDDNAVDKGDHDQAEAKMALTASTGHENGSSPVKNKSHTTVISQSSRDEEIKEQQKVDEGNVKNDNSQQSEENVTSCVLIDIQSTDKQEEDVNKRSGELEQSQQQVTECKSNTEISKKPVKRGHVVEGRPSNNKRRKYTPRPPQKSYTLLEKLLSKEIRRERNKILQCVHFIVKNKFFED